MSALTVLYGSLARGDADELSDRDLMIVNPGEGMKIGALREADSVVTYSWSELHGMRAYGSLFLRHLARESVVVDGDPTGREEYRSLLSDLPPYSRAAKDIRAFRMGVNDSLEAVRDGSATLEFEGAHLATIVRHSAILGCYLIGQETYSRHGAVTTFSNECNMLDVIDSFQHFYRHRLALARKVPSPPPPDELELLAFAHQVQTFVREVRRAHEQRAVH